MEVPPPADQVPTDGTAAAAPPGRKLKRSTRIALTVLLIVALIAGGAFATSYFVNVINYVSTDNAQVDGDAIRVKAPVDGTLVDWRATHGAELRKDQLVGRIKIQNGTSQPLRSIRAPADGVVAEDNGVPDGFVTAGTELAVAYNLNKIYVTARVDETDIKAVRVGQQVDIAVDAFPNARITGHVREVQGGSAGTFSLFPEANTTSNYQKVTQLIPVKIIIMDDKGLDLVPGMNVVVHIHKR